MDIFAELKELPFYYYQLEHGEWILGGKRTEEGPTGDKDIIRAIWNEMTELYNSDDRSIEIKKKLGECVKRMGVYCEGADITTDNLKKIVGQWDTIDKEKIAQQINMYKDSREYYREYVFLRNI